ncbi:hypothetical protein COO60DRAFT_1527802 [Scenedesmus sp. NREL 46B-D3]|nr:hypothetical protein COO60DRAFT_1527802 [Scenedesmus sp. NREL 46B-D3]
MLLRRVLWRVCVACWRVRSCPCHECCPRSVHTTARTLAVRICRSRRLHSERAQELQLALRAAAQHWTGGSCCLHVCAAALRGLNSGTALPQWRVASGVACTLAGRRVHCCGRLQCCVRVLQAAGALPQMCIPGFLWAEAVCFVGVSYPVQCCVCVVASVQHALACVLVWHLFHRLGRAPIGRLAQRIALLWPPEVVVQARGWQLPSRHMWCWHNHSTLGR